jgi:flagellar biosynthesis protein FlhG
MRFNAKYDQAAGLRQLLLGNQTQVVTLVSGKTGVGCTSAAFNLAMIAAQAGKRVLVLDEHRAPNGLLGKLHLSARHDLLDVVMGTCLPVEAVLKIRGVEVLPAGRALDALTHLKLIQRHQYDQALADVGRNVDMVVVDAAMRSGQAKAPLNLIKGSSLLALVDATARGITDSYAMLKQMVLDHPGLQFGIVVSRVASEQAAMAVYGNLAQVARNHFAMHLEYLGYIPEDAKLEHANQLGRAAVEMFPTAPSAKSYVALSNKLQQFSDSRNEFGKYGAESRNLSGGERYAARTLTQKLAQVFS